MGHNTSRRPLPSDFFYPVQNPSYIPINLSVLLIITGILIFINGANPLNYLVNWGVVLFYETYAIIGYSFRILNKIVLIFLAILSAATISSTIWKCNSTYSYNPMITLDFFIMVLLTFVSLVPVIRICLADRLLEEAEGFFIMTGFSLYCALQVLSGIVVYLDIFENFAYASTSIKVLMIYWIISVPWIHYLKSNYSLK